MQACFSVIPAAAALFSFDPSVAQPPLPLQEFFPAQECFSTLVLVEVILPLSCACGVAAVARVMVPESRPARAADIITEFFEGFIEIGPLVRKSLSGEPSSLEFLACKLYDEEARFYSCGAIKTH